MYSDEFDPCATLVRMNSSDLLSAVNAEITLLKEVRDLLSGYDAMRGTFSGRKKRVLSAEARARIAAAQRKRWAKQKRVANRAA